jgi:hypothetical protein
MIKPHDLIALADRLAAISAEPEGRAAVGRAYYGAFHRAVTLLEEGCGVVLPRDRDVHGKLRFCLEQSKNDDLIKIASKLDTLRAERNKADYHLGDSKFARPVNVQAQLILARTIVSEIDAASAKSAEFKPAIRKYASEVLKLGVR